VNVRGGKRGRKKAECRRGRKKEKTHRTQKRRTDLREERGRARNVRLRKGGHGETRRDQGCTHIEKPQHGGGKGERGTHKEERQSTVKKKKIGNPTLFTPRKGQAVLEARPGGDVCRDVKGKNLKGTAKEGGGVAVTTRKEEVL